MTFEEIKQYLKSDFELFEDRMKSTIKSNIPLLNIITNYLLKTKGKQMRPMFVFLAARMCGTINARTYTAASMIELLHTATLVHDDVVDDSNLRRGFFSINALWKNKAAVLVGDFLLSRGLLVSLEENEFELLKIMSGSVQEMSEGELLQIEKARKLDITEEVYYDIISKKTATLIKTACKAGAYSTSSNTELTEKMKEIGHHIGMAFQIKDDIFDFGTDDVGKPLGNDIKEQKMTLPLIYTLNKVSFIEKQRIMAQIKYFNTKKSSIEYVTKSVIQHGGIEYAQSKMNEYIHKAKSILSEFPDSNDKTAFLSLIDYTIDRKK